MERQSPNDLDRHPGGRDRVIVVGGSDRTLDLLRLATIRSDDVVLIGEICDVGVRRFAQRFAIEVRARSIQEADFVGANTVLIAIGDVELENAVVRAARRIGVPVYVADRDLVSDFGLLEFLEQRPSAALAA